LKEECVHIGRAFKCGNCPLNPINENHPDQKIRLRKALHPQKKLDEYNLKLDAEKKKKFE